MIEGLACIDGDKARQDHQTCTKDILQNFAWKGWQIAWAEDVGFDQEGRKELEREGAEDGEGIEEADS